MDHVVDQAVTILKHRKVTGLFTTPKLLEALAEKVNLWEAGIRGVFCGGTTMAPQYVRFIVEEVLEESHRFLSDLRQHAHGPGRQRAAAAGGQLLDHLLRAATPRRAARGRPEAHRTRSPPYGEWGRVELTTLTKEFFMPRFLERDEAIRREPGRLTPGMAWLKCARSARWRRRSSKAFTKTLPPPSLMNLFLICRSCAAANPTKASTKPMSADHRNGQPLATVSQVNAGHHSQGSAARGRIARGVEEASPLTSCSRFATGRASWFLKGTLPLGTRAHTQSPEQYIETLLVHQRFALRDGAAEHEEDRQRSGQHAHGAQRPDPRPGLDHLDRGYGEQSGARISYYPRRTRSAWSCRAIRLRSIHFGCRPFRSRSR